MSDIALAVVAVSHRGLARDDNEDSLGIDGWLLAALDGYPLATTLSLDRPRQLVVADGMGGHNGGAEASRQAVESLARNSGADIIAALQRASDGLRARAELQPWLHGMGSTIVGLMVEGANVTIFNVGDSRAYRLVDGYLGRLTRDDRLAEGESVLTQYLGGERKILLEPHLFTVPLVVGERFLLCSDGLHDVVPDADIERMLAGTPETIASTLLTAAMDAGGPDNISIIIAEVVDAA